MNVYSTTTNPKDPSYDRVIRQIRGGDPLMLTYLPQTPSVQNQQAVLKVIQNDRNGNVSERLYDAGSRLVNLKEFTGRAIPGVAVTETMNRPLNRLRATDPDFFETRHEFNADFLPTRTIHPNGNITERIYESELSGTNAPVRRGATCGSCVASRAPTRLPAIRRSSRSPLNTTPALVAAPAGSTSSPTYRCPWPLDPQPV